MLTEPLELDIRRLRDDFTYYASKLLYIRDKTSRIRKFVLNNTQTRLNKIFSERLKRGRTFIYILKARQEGVSTWAEGRIFHAAHMFKNTRSVVIANDADGSENVFNMSRLYFDMLPKPYKPMVRYSSKRELVFENPSSQGREYDPGLRSGIEVFTAGRGTAGRSWTVKCVHLSEFAFFADGETLITSIVPTIPNAPGCFMILETTANGVGNFAHEEWIRYKNEYEKWGESSELIPIFLAWHTHDEYETEFLNEKERKMFIGSLTREEKDYMKRFNLTYEKLLWRRKQIAAMRGDVDAFIQEYPSDDKEAFVSSGQPLFNRGKIRSAQRDAKDTIWRGEITGDGKFIENPRGRLKVWAWAQRDREYVVSVDPCGDTEQEKEEKRARSDRAVIQVIDKKTLEQVAEWADRINPLALPAYIRAIGVAWGGIHEQALVAIEINGPGLAVQYELMQSYWNLYRWQRWDNMEYSETKKLGWETNVRTKPMLIDFATFVFHNSYCKVNSHDLLDEMYTFIRTANSGEADVGAHDDFVMSWMIGLFVAGNGRTEFMTHGPKVETNVKQKDKSRRIIDEACIDVDELGLTRQEQFDHWMAY